MSYCIIWEKSRHKDGYGIAWHKQKRRLAHRVAYCEYNNVDIDSIEHKVIMHSCDNPPCVNPDHLILGTQQDNIKDMHNKGRYRNGVIGTAKPLLAYNNSEGILFNNYKEAEKQGFDLSAITKCSKGKRKSHKGYSWMYL